MDKLRRIHGAGGGGGGGGGNQTVVVQQSTTVVQQAPVRQPTYTPDDPGLKSTSFAQLQFLLCEGDVEGPVHGNTVEGLERSVYLDDTPIRVGSAEPTPQPSDLVFSWGRPSPEQTGVPGFNRVSSVTSVDTEVRKNFPVAQTVTVADPAATWYGRVIITFNALVMNRNSGDNPGTFATGVDIRVEYEDNLSVVREVFDGNISGKFSGSFQREFEFPFEGEAPWTVRVYRNTDDDQDRSGGGTTYQSKFNFSTVVLSLDQKLIYPHSSMLSLGIRADQYSQLPKVSIDLRGMRIEVPSNYDPETRVYTGDWDGTFQTAYSNNPAWVLRDLIVQDRYGLGSYINVDQVDKWTLYQIAQYCDQEVPASGGGTEPRFTCNLILQTAEEAWTVLQQLSSIFRGLLYYAAGSIISIQDRPKTPVFTFNESNTIEAFDDSGKISEGNFSYSGTAQRARHTAVLASYDDPSNNYQPRVEYIADEEGIARFGYKAMDLRLIGVTSRGQALRAANWALISERELTDTVTFKTNEIGSAVRPGDLVSIADPTKAARRYGGRITAVAGNVITLDDTPTEPPAGWAGSTFSYMIVDAEGEPVLQTRDIAALAGNQVTLTAATGVTEPVATFPWLIESPDRTAQLFRIMGVEEQDDGVYSFTALRYREDIYDAVDNGTPLNENEDYLFRPQNPLPPTWETAQIIWDNSQAKLDLAWVPPDTNTVLNGFDLTIREYRVQYQAGSYQADGSIQWDEVWREIERQVDNREQVPINQFVATDRFRVRALSVSRVGVESEWTDIRLVDDITTWFPMPDLGGDNGATPPVPNATLLHFNQSSGSQLFSWGFNVDLPPYVNGVLIEAKPSRPLTEIEEAGLNPPNADGWYVAGTRELDNYFAIAFHALVNWEMRLSLTTAIQGIEGATYTTDMVDRLELVPPIPQRFVVVTEPRKHSTPLTRRFSWDFIEEPPFVEKWPLGYVNDIVSFEVRFKAGTTVDWDLGFPLYSDGIPGDQRWFETTLFDSGAWVVMLRTRDRTGWLSDEIQFVSVNLADALPTNVVERFDLKDVCFPGTYTNCAVEGRTSGLMYPDPQVEAFYQNPQDDDFYEGGAGCVLAQDSLDEEARYIYPLTVSDNGVGLVIYTQSTGTYQWFIRKTSDTVGLMYPEPLGDSFYEAPLTDFFYVNITPDIDSAFHPLAPFEKLNAGTYEIGVRLQSRDGTHAAEIHDIDVVLDYPDLTETFNDVFIPAGGSRVTLQQSFRVLKAVSLTLQDPLNPGVAATARVSGKDQNGFNVRCYDVGGNDVAGLIDAICVGY